MKLFNSSLILASLFARPSNANLFGDLDDPAYPQICPSEPSDPKIPEKILKKLDKGFRSNGGAVLTRQGDYSDLDLLERVRMSTDDYISQIERKLSSPAAWESFDTPLYEFGDTTVGDDIGAGFNTCRGEGPCTPPEPYPFRTNLPRMAQPRCLQDPYVVFVPATYEDAALAIKTLGDYDEKFTIISGGHDYECQSAAPGHALIITSRLNKIEFDWSANPPTVKAGAGVLWQSIYDKLYERERDFGSRWGYPGAICGYVSVSGFLLGGGFGWMMAPWHGIGAEGAISIKTALADGQIIDAGVDNEYSQLRWALAGSGGLNLAMALEFTLELRQSLPRGYNISQVEYRWIAEEESEGYEAEAAWLHKEWITAIDKIKDSEGVGGAQVALRRQSYGLQLAASAACNDCDLIARKSTGFARLLQKTSKEPLYARTSNYTSINDFMKFNPLPFYPGSDSRPHFSNFIKSTGKSVETTHDVMMKKYIPQYDGSDLPENFDPDVAGSDFNWYLVQGSMKDTSLTSLRPEIAGAAWHATIRSSHSFDEDVLEKIRCRHRATLEELKEKLGDRWIGPYMNYFDTNVGKVDYYGPYLDVLMEIKHEYDPKNLFKKARGLGTVSQY